MNEFITVSCLGNLGHFGNQLFQYASARAFAEFHNVPLHTPDWEGRRVFENINEPIMNEKGDVDFHGYYQEPDWLKLLSRKKLKEWFKPKPEYLRGGFNVIAHKRRGDYITAGPYAIVTDQSYDKAIEKFGYDPKTVVTYDCSRPREQQYQDFFDIMQSKVIFRANSTYSWWAATLSDAKVYAPVVKDKTGWQDVEFEEGNHHQLSGLFPDFVIGD